ncbi:MAG: hypothetical protein IPF56_16230 [Chloroflexi bacterium]|nr:hypothetical protein [Chloroflexota bacterium]
MTERPLPTHHLAKLDELWAERPFPPTPWLNLMNVGRTAVPTPPPG